MTGVDDHSRFCVIASVVERATGRAVCLAFAAALARFGVPEEVLTDNGKQFTDRFGRGGEVLFDKICRHNGITHRLTQPASPTTTGKVERFHQTLRRELLDDTSRSSRWPRRRPRSTSGSRSTTPTGRTRRWTSSGRSPRRTASPRPAARSGSCCRCGCPRRSLPSPARRTEPAATPTRSAELETGPAPAAAWTGWAGRVRPGRPAGGEPATRRPTVLARAGSVRSGVRFWADADLIHLFIGGARIKTVRSHLTVTDLARLVAEGAVTGRPVPAAADRTRRRGRGRPGRQPRRHGRPGRARRARRGDPRRPPGRASGSSATR